MGLARGKIRDKGTLPEYLHTHVKRDFPACQGDLVFGFDFGFRL